MIIWLASYPRSGNTMLRMLLKQVFGVDSYSLYDDQGDIGANSAVSSDVGHRQHGSDAEDFVRSAVQSEDLVFVKTHDPPQGGGKAIFVIRDGRAATVSYWHYLHQIRGEERALEDVVAGNVLFTSWSEHYEAWSPETRPDTLFLRYEEAREWSPSLVARIAEFTGLEPKEQASNDFARMHALAPSFFRKADNEANIAELQGPAADLFWMLHGEAMVKLGYAASAPRPKPAAARRAILQFRDRAREATFTQEQRTLEIERDRQARLEAILAREDELARINADLSALSARYAEAEADRQARLQVILEREAKLDRLQAELKALSERYVEAEADRQARLDVILNREAELERLQAELKAQGERYVEAEADRQARLDVILKREAELEQLRANLNQLSERYIECETDRHARLNVILDRERSIVALQAEILALRTLVTV